MKYAHVVNLKACKDDPQQVVVFFLVLFFLPHKLKLSTQFLKCTTMCTQRVMRKASLGLQSSRIRQQG